jgi:peptidylprolyl isomerase
MTTFARFALILLLAAGLVAAACGDDDDDNGGEAPAATSTPSDGAATTEADGDAATSTPAAGGETPANSGDGPPEVTGEPTVTDSGLQIIETEVGGGQEATADSTVRVHYTLWLEDGTQIESSVGGDPITFALADLIPAWQEGIPGMKEGGKRRLIVPPELGYGEAGSPPDIPPNATLIFDIQLMDVQ